MAIADDVDVFYGLLSANRAHVYVRVNEVRGGEDWNLQEYLRGPFCRQVRTLTATIPIRDCGPGSTLLGEAILPDPCFWNPSVPAYYEIHAKIRQAGGRELDFKQQLGLRHLGTDGRDLLWENRRWVLRAVHCKDTLPATMDRWNQASAAFVTDEPDEDTCRSAGREGVLLVLRIAGSSRSLRDSFRHWSRYPAVAVIAVDEPPETDDEPPSAATNILRAQWISAQQEIQATDWAQLVFCELDDSRQRAMDCAQLDRPVIAVCRSSQPCAVEEARAACDALQRDLSPFAQFAGYVV